MPCSDGVPAIGSKPQNCLLHLLWRVVKTLVHQSCTFHVLPCTTRQEAMISSRKIKTQIHLQGSKSLFMASSIQQSQQGESSGKPNGGGCGRNCLSKCCLLRGAELPLFAFSNDLQTANPNLLDLIFELWDDRMRRGLFRHSLTKCETKIIPGEHGFIAQFNEGRHLTRRPTEFRVDRVLQDFDGSKFNFTKVGQEEALLRVEESETGKPGFFPGVVVPPSSSPDIVAINVSPIEYGHVLLIPRILDCLPQRIDPKSFLLALRFAVEAGNPYFRLGFNSLGAFATVNHLHFQAYYLTMPFPVEKASMQRWTSLENGVEILKLSRYPVRGLVFQGGGRLQELADAVSSACIFLQDYDNPFNILIADCGKRVFLFPQCYVEKRARGQVSKEILDMELNPAIWEICGHMVFKLRKDHSEASEEKVCALLAALSVSEERFQELQMKILEVIRHTEDASGEGGSY